ncbi:glutamate racemase [Patescibacteria group bacterium]|nr:glutamate racemase [Patescibacteria group bacterium]MBU1662975.1 glutamate racemase [Patescibacteria group bacterium]MBU1933940.1 glutamate racemase [Patescibacteria group bacterium]MBU2264478.1 glutamate racemase [Patescibacteria group bacterium]
MDRSETRVKYTASGLKNIGVFDSGFGGLTMFKEFLKVLPDYDYIYLGDNARAPYGNKSDEVIYNYTKQAIDFLFKQDCELIIIACHTASAKALRKIQQEYLLKNYSDKKVLGVVVPIVEEAIKLSRYHKLGIIGTKATINSDAYKKELEKLRSDLKIFQQACPLLVPLVEEGWVKKPETKMILKKYLLPLKVKQIDTLILGCTHYLFLIKDIIRIMGKNVKIINPAIAVAEKLAIYLDKHKDLEKKLSKNKKIIFYTTDDVIKFKELGQRFLGKSIENINKIIL